jgi:UDPglucose 6-dehydrogenase
VTGADAIVIATAWDEFRSIDPSLLGGDGRRRVLVDCWRILPRERFEQIVDYVVLGLGELSREAATPG